MTSLVSDESLPRPSGRRPALGNDCCPDRMSLEAQERLVRDLMLHLDQVVQIDAALDALHHALSALGYSALAYGATSGPRLPNGALASPIVKTRDFPTGWDKYWDHLSDPYYRLCATRTLALKWTEVQNDSCLSDEEKACISHLDDRNLHYGVTIPMHMPNGSFAFVSAISANQYLYETGSSQQSINTVFALCHYFQNALFWNNCKPYETDKKPSLSRREEECLCLAAQGKTSEDIALILGLSNETVRTHLKHAIVRLNATNRAHAVAKAVHFGLLPYTPAY